MKKVKVIVFIVALIIGLMFAKVFGFSLGFKLPSMNCFSGIKGSGMAKTEKRNLADFKEIEVGGIIEVEITAQKDFSVEVQADDNLLEYIETEVSGDTLKIHTNKRISPQTKIRIIISMPELTGLEVSGVSKTTATNIKTDSFKIDISGASKVVITGQAKDLNIEASGVSKVNAEGLKVENAEINSSGASNLTVSVSNELNADASGASQVNYVGDPKNLIKDTSGASSIKQK